MLEIGRALLDSFGFFLLFCCSFGRPMRVRAHCSLKKNRWFNRNSIDERIWIMLNRKTMTKKSFMLREMKSWNNNVLLKLISDSESEAHFFFCKHNVITTHRNCYRCLMLNVQRYSSRWNDLIETSALRCWNDHIVSDGIFCLSFTCTDCEHCWSCCSLWLFIKRWQLIFGSCPYIQFYLLIRSGAHSVGVCVVWCDVEFG